MKNKMWQLTINRIYYPYKNDWEAEEDDNEYNKVKYIKKTLLFDKPLTAQNFFFRRIVKGYEKKYKNFQQFWIDVDSYSFRNGFDFEIVDHAEYRESYDYYDFSLTMSLELIDIKKRLTGLEQFKNIISDNIGDFLNPIKTDRQKAFKDIWEYMRKCGLWS